MLPKSLDFRNRNVRDAAVALLVILVAVVSFALGRLSQTGMGGERKSRVTIIQREGSETLQAAVSTAPIAGGVVASKTGSKYHLPWCAGAGTIREENKIWFANTAEARKAGYTPAANCKGIQ